MKKDETYKCPRCGYEESKVCFETEDSEDLQCPKCESYYIVEVEKEKS